MNAIPLSLYVHLPWCVTKCPYCDFNSYEMKQDIPEDDYIDALIADLHRQKNNVGERKIISVFIGGGTPSIFSANSIQRLLQASYSLLTISNQVEITIEANPGALDQERCSGFRDAGINRISIGAQSFSTLQLQRLGRIHDVQDIIESVQTARQAGFENFNIDLMYALPDQEQRSALYDVEQSIALGASHISYYQLTIEPDTHFYRHPPMLPNKQTAWEMQQAGMQLLADHGYQQYEVSAYAKTSQQCIHNVNYWQFGDYLGIGAGAHQKLSFPSENKIIRHANPKHPRQYMQAMRETTPSGSSRVLTQQDIIFEFLLNALRLKQGFSKQQFEVHTGLNIKTIAETLDSQVRDGLLIRQDDTIRCSEQGYRFLDTLLQSWLP